MTLQYCIYLFLSLRNELTKDYSNWIACLGIGSIMLLFIVVVMFHSFQYIPILHTTLVSFNHLLPAQVNLFFVKFKTKLSPNDRISQTWLDDSNTVFREPLLESAN